MQKSDVESGHLMAIETPELLAAALLAFAEKYTNSIAGEVFGAIMSGKPRQCWCFAIGKGGFEIAGYRLPA